VYERFAQSAIERLTELRLVTIERRIDADLVLGRHAELVGELRELVREHPLRERLRAQLMLALYRSHRQVEALEVYRQTRQLLADEFGLEPGKELHELERAILDNDPSLLSPEPASAGAGGAAETITPAAAMPRRRWSARRVGLVAAILVAATAAAAAIVATGGSASPTTPVAGAIARNQVVGIDPQTGRVSTQLPFPGSGSPHALASGQLVWVGNDTSNTVSAIDPRRGAVTNLVSLGGFPGALAVDAGALWALDPAKGLLIKVDPAYGLPVGKARVIRPNPAADVRQPIFAVYSVAAGNGSVWITDGSTKLTQVDPASLRLIRRIDLHAPLDGVTTGDGSVWATSGPKAEVFRLDRHGRLTTTIAIVAHPGPLSAYPLTVRVGEGSVWVLNGNTGTITKIDPVQRIIDATITVDVSRGPSALAIGYGACWIADGDGTLTRIDTTTSALKVIKIAEYLKDVTLAHGTVWVTT
jgi:streptogramin lyase